ncbi:hypothetical protein KSP40_PGU001144 [Platanthera guangdongensis]|uniref:Uncharacterized protein n=1 Tax=Platanthera guangdongensis TaxID=2320717 RepID=A0ABR2LNY9_9ASPA
MDYALIGDDVVIADENVGPVYASLVKDISGCHQCEQIGRVKKNSSCQWLSSSFRILGERSPQYRPEGALVMNSSRVSIVRLSTAKKDQSLRA